MVWLLLWGRLLPGSLHIRGLWEAALHPVHLAGRPGAGPQLPERVLLWPELGQGQQGPSPLSPLQGRHASQDELAASAYQAVEVDQRLHGAPVQVRVTMGKEPRHFMAIFKGKLVIFEVRTVR